MIEKEKKNLEKLKRRQKNEIEAEIESKIKSEMIRQKSELKEKHIQLLNEKLHEKLGLIHTVYMLLTQNKIKYTEHMRQWLTLPNYNHTDIEFFGCLSYPLPGTNAQI